MKKKLAIFGPYPPPLGGISVHIKRIENWLIKESIPYTIYNHWSAKGENVIATNKNPFFYIKFLFNYNYKLIHFHQFFNFHFPYYFFFSFLNPTPIIITIHSERLLHYNKWKRKLLLFFLKYTRNKKVISVSKKLNDLFNKNKIPSIYLPAYVPIYSKEKVDLKLNPEKKHFLYSIWRLQKDVAEDIYNVPLVFDFLRRNKDKFHMTFMIATKEESDLQYLDQMLTKYDIKENVDLIFGQPLEKYYHNFDFFIRSNTSDGWGLSVQEAIDSGIPAIASDTCVRPKGTVLFKNNDIEDLENKVNFVINADPKTILANKQELNYHLDLIDIYKNALK